MGNGNGSANTALTVTGDPGDILYKLVVEGDVSKFSPSQQAEYYTKVCESLGLNPLTKPFDYIVLNGKKVLYAKKDATEQLRKINGVSVEDMSGKEDDGLYIVTVKVKDRDGRTDMATGVIPIIGQKGEMKANTMMKAETKAKRRATLSICGLGILDESEIEDIKAAEEKPLEVAEKKIGEIEKALKTISAAKTAGEIEKYEKMIATRIWTDEELVKLNELIEVKRAEFGGGHESAN